eukprot:869067_1
MSSLEATDDELKCDDEFIAIVKDLPHGLKKILRELIFTNKICIDCQTFVGPQSYFCHACALKRFQSICKSQIASYRIDKNKKWGIYFYSIKLTG